MFHSLEMRSELSAPLLSKLICNKPPVALIHDFSLLLFLVLLYLGQREKMVDLFRCRTTESIRTPSSSHQSAYRLFDFALLDLHAVHTSQSFPSYELNKKDRQITCMHYFTLAYELHVINMTVHPQIQNMYLLSYLFC